MTREAGAAEAIRLEQRGPVAWIYIDRPHKRNAMTVAMWRRLGEVLDSLRRPQVGAVVITGAGGNFAAGADILEFDESKRTPAAARASFLAVDEVCHAIGGIGLPVIAAIDGYAVGAGLELAVACDMRLATAAARLGITGAKLGITVGYRHIQRLMAVVGAARALDLLMTARLVEAPEAERLGLVQEIVPDGAALAQRAQELGELLASRAPLSIAWAKQAVRRLLRDPDLATVGDEVDEAIRCFETDDFREAAAAFREHRSPRFVGH